MVKLINFKDKQFICLVQEPHFRGFKPSSIDKRYMQVLHGKGTKKLWPRAMIVASKDLKLSLIDALTSRDTTCINLPMAALAWNPSIFEKLQSIAIRTDFLGFSIQNDPMY